MNGVESWVLGYLMNSFWQVPLLAAAGWVAARVVRRAGVRMEHRVWVATLLLEAVVPTLQVRAWEMVVAAWGVLARSWGGAAGVGQVRVAMGAGVVSGHEMLRLPGWVFASLLAVYAGGMVYVAGRLGWGLWRTERMQREAQRVTLHGASAAMWERCRGVFGLDAPELAVSPRVSGPVTVGGRSGVLLVPPDFLERVEANDLGAVIAHEFAHMRRRDFAKNVMYSVLTLPVAYHPALWLTRSRVAESREMVCDALAAEAVFEPGAGRERYARSLLRLAGMLVQARPARTLHAIGIFDANLFERRVMHLTETRMEVGGVRRLAMVAVCAVVGLAACGSALALRMEVTAPAAAGAGGQAADKPIRVSGGVMAGNNLTKVPPVYPPEAKAAGITGAVVMSATIGKDGTVQNLQVVSGPEKLRASALDSVRQWTYKPYLLNGQPRDVDTTVTVTYSLTN
jgi:TonB family protein